MLELLFGYAAGQEADRHATARSAVDGYARAPASQPMPGDHKTVLIQTYGYGIKGAFNSAYRMDMRSGHLDRIASSRLCVDGNFITNFKQDVALVSGLR